MKFQDPSMLAAARAHVGSVRWRLVVWGVFAIGAALALDSFAAGAAWFLALGLAAGFDAVLGGSYLGVRGAKEQATTGALFVWGCAFSAIIFAAMPLYLVAQGGGAGRVLGVLMAASAFVRVMLFLSRARGFMLVVGAPSAICLLLMPFLPLQGGSMHPLQSALAVGVGVVAFLAYVLRAALNHNAVLGRLESAHAQAKQGQREAEATRVEAEAANRAKSEFLLVVTHELRTPLNAVIGYAEILAEDMAGAERPESVRHAGRIARSARNLLGLIDQVLVVASGDSGQDAPQVRRVDVRGLIEERISALQGDIHASGNRVSVLVGAGAQWAETDSGKLGACLDALLSNAVKFTECGLIAVTAEWRQAGNWLAIAVSDTGAGIAAGDQERIFSPFIQADGTLARAKGGLGLGLAIAQRTATMLGGAISVHSEIGAGSTFTLRIPLRMAATSPTVKRAAA